jgi:outer membrane protein OmpA-like peptidoglycan-associated protein
VRDGSRAPTVRRAIGPVTPSFRGSAPFGTPDADYRCMKTTLAALLLTSSVALADNAPIGPDFVGTAPRAHIDPSLTASGAMNRIDPVDIVAFRYNSPDLSSSALVQIDRSAAWLKRHPRFRLVLEGHTDRLGVDPYNEDLATRRVQAVRERLMRRGITSDRIVLITYGEAQAIAPENPEDRRVVMFASDQPVRDVVATQLGHRHALVATWTEQGSRLQMMSDAALQPGTTAVSRR